jgi:outer membrane protein OmpA-like peptidoglycan-associated protein
MMGDFIEPEIPKTITPPSKKEPTVVQLDIESPFEFDKVTLTPEAEQKFKQFVQDIKTNYQGVKGDVEVICSASIDADPAKKAQYNQKLSENRAITIVNRLKNETGITTLNFIPKGIGQTSQFAPELKWPEVTDESKTAPNRRLIIKLPKLIKK